MSIEPFSLDTYTNHLTPGDQYRGFVYRGGYGFHCAVCGAMVAPRALLDHASWHAGLDGWAFELRTDNGLYALR